MAALHHTLYKMASSDSRSDLEGFESDIVEETEINVLNFDNIEDADVSDVDLADDLSDFDEVSSANKGNSTGENDVLLADFSEVPNIDFIDDHGMDL